MFPEVVAGDDVDISATSFVAFQQCHEQAAARFRGEYGPDSRPGFTGQLAHRIFARHLESGAIAGDFEQVCRQEIGSGLNPKMGSLGLKPSELRGVIEEVSALYERFKSLDFDGFAGAEVAVEVSPSPGVTLKGTVDAVFGADTGWRLVDWKTGNIADAADLQLGFYALLWVLDRGVIPARVEAVSVKTGERRRDEPGEASVAATARQVASMIDVLRHGWSNGTPFERRGGPWCSYCPVLSSCDEGAAATKVAG